MTHNRKVSNSEEANLAGGEGGVRIIVEEAEG